MPARGGGGTGPRATPSAPRTARAAADLSNSEPGAPAGTSSTAEDQQRRRQLRGVADGTLHKSATDTAPGQPVTPGAGAASVGVRRRSAAEVSAVMSGR